MLPCVVVQPVHHGVVCVRVLLADPGEQQTMLAVDVDESVTRERGGPVRPGLPFQERSMELWSGCREHQPLGLERVNTHCGANES